MDSTGNTKPRKSLLDDPRFLGAAMKSLYSSSSASVERGDQTRVITHQPGEAVADASAGDRGTGTEPNRAGGGPRAPEDAGRPAEPAGSRAAPAFDGGQRRAAPFTSAARPAFPAIPREAAPAPRAPAAGAIAKGAGRDEAVQFVLDAVDEKAFRSSSSGNLLYWVLTLASFFILSYLLSR